MDQTNDNQPLSKEDEQIMFRINFLHKFVQLSSSRYKKMSPQLRSQLFLDKLYLIFESLPFMAMNGCSENMNKVVKQQLEQHINEIQTYFLDELNILNDHVLCKEANAILDINKKLDACLLSPDCHEGPELMKSSKIDFVTNASKFTSV